MIARQNGKEGGKNFSIDLSGEKWSTRLLFRWLRGKIGPKRLRYWIAKEKQ